MSNLVFLCVEHHDRFDSRTSQSKNFTVEEVRLYRDQLHKELAASPIVPPTSTEDPTGGVLADLRRVTEADPHRWCFLSKPWRSIVFDEVLDYLFAYKAPGSDGVCHIHRRRLPDGRTLVVCEQLPDNPGRSITNAVELIAFQVCVRFSIEPWQLIWIEHYGPELGLNTYSRVEFEIMPPDGMFEKPSWHRMKKTDWETLGIRRPRSLKKRPRSTLSTTEWR